MATVEAFATVRDGQMVFAEYQKAVVEVIVVSMVFALEQAAKSCGEVF